MYIDKLGLYHNPQNYKDALIAKFKPYEFSQKDFLTQSSKISCLVIETKHPFKIKNSVLYFKEHKIDISNMLLIDLINYLGDSVNIKNIVGREYLIYAPALLLSDCNNRKMTQIKGDVSPLRLKKYLTSNKTISALNISVIEKIKVFNLQSGVVQNHLLLNDNLYFEPTNNTTILVEERNDKFSLYIDFNIKYVRDGNSVGNLLKHGEEL